MSWKLDDEEMPYELRRAFELELVTWQEAQGLADIYQKMQHEPGVSIPEWLQEAHNKVTLLGLPPHILLLM